MELSTGRLFFADDGGDLGEAMVDYLVQDVDGALDGGEALQEDEEGERDGFAVGGLVREDRLGQPWSDVLFAPRTRRLEVVQAEPGHDRREPCLRRFDGRRVGGLPAQPRVLQDVFGLRRRAEHPVGDAEEQPAMRLKGFDGLHDRGWDPPEVRGGAVLISLFSDCARASRPQDLPRKPAMPRSTSSTTSTHQATLTDVVGFLRPRFLRATSGCARAACLSRSRGGCPRG
jgi:hypothetical protein